MKEGKKEERGSESASEGEDEVQDGSARDFVLRRGFVVVHLLPREDQSLLWRRNSFLLLHLKPVN